MPIKVLDPKVVARIAAGEVVERPASVVKELVENSLDASSSQISIEVRGGGVSLIRVTDNGAGIPSGEVELAFQRYATNKISNLEDLVALVDRMLELNKRLAPIRNTSFGEREELLREIKRTDAEIDQKVYELYGLTEEERQIIDASLAKTVF